ncbi:MAG: hypothetical protein ABI824_04570 [Acidobacteriota bacterium]
MKQVRFGAALAAALPLGVIQFGFGIQAAQAQAPTVQAQPLSVAAPAAAPAPPASPPDMIDLARIAQAQIATVPDVDKRIADIDAWVLKYPNSTYKGYAFGMAGQASQMKQDRKGAIAYYEKALEVDPKDHMSMLMIAAETAQGTTEHDLQKDEKLEHADFLLSQAMILIPISPKLNPAATDEQWAQVRKDDMAQAYETSGLIAMVRKKYDDAAKAFQQSINTASTKQPATYVRLGNALNEAKKYDEATKALDQALAMPGLPDQIKRAAENEKTRTQQLRTMK